MVPILLLVLIVPSSRFVPKATNASQQRSCQGHTARLIDIEGQQTRPVRPSHRAFPSSVASICFPPTLQEAPSPLLLSCPPQSTRTHTSILRSPVFLIFNPFPQHRARFLFVGERLKHIHLLPCPCIYHRWTAKGFRLSSLPSPLLHQAQKEGAGGEKKPERTGGS